MRIISYDLELEQKVPMLIKENSVNYTTVEGNQLNSPNKIARTLSDVFRLDKKAQEHVYLICMNAKGHPLGFFEISKGTANASLCFPRDVFMRALLCGATNIVLAHNHPSGDTSPSPEDMNLTKRIQEAGCLMDIQLLDHIIIGHDGVFTSLKEQGFITCR